ncbi:MULTISPECIES: phage holin family protein [Halomonas]|uniref:Putative membrane protein YqjE n=1 Tax=Halomonas ventosae TaxID=229007 RepID=A0A4R6I6X0_9GAMM|nr:phage holin family protein [Halomonas ventosae]TDO16505.1 putative membrane protein YqjE [Halomonas ventosae]
MGASQGPAERLFTATQRLIVSLLAIGETRLRLAVVEIEEERARLVTLSILAGLALVLVLLGIGTLTALVVVIFWETHRLMAIGVSGLVLLSLGLILILWIMRLARRRILLASTLKHLATDRELMEMSRDRS